MRGRELAEASSPAELVAVNQDGEAVAREFFESSTTAGALG